MKTLLLTGLLLFAVPLFVHAEQSSLNNRYERIEWQQTLSLPTRDAAPHPGVAGAFSGFIGDYLVIAGGANFPNGMPWENGEKKWHQSLYAIQPESPGSSWTISEHFFAFSYSVWNKY